MYEFYYPIFLLITIYLIKVKLQCLYVVFLQYPFIIRKNPCFSQDSHSNQSTEIFYDLTCGHSAQGILITTIT